MKRSVSFVQMLGFLFTAVAGTLLHFLFDWTGGRETVALFSAVNESIWEHLKLLFYPMVVFAVVEYFLWGRNAESFWCIKLIGILIGLVGIPVVYYTYTGALGIRADWVNIVLFFLTAGIVYRTETKLFLREFTCPSGKKTAMVLLCLIGVLFTVFTFLPPRVPLFQDPITGAYGFQG